MLLHLLAAIPPDVRGANLVVECKAKDLIEAIESDIELRQTVADPAAALEHAIELARRQETKLWELRATTRLGQLLQQQGRLDEARRRVAPIYRGFTEGFGTRDLAAARALLGEP